VANGVVYSVSKDGALVAVTGATRAVLWRYHAVGPAHAPTVADGRVYFGAATPVQGNGPPGPFFLYAVDATSGALVWRQGVENDASFAPLVSNGVVYVGTAENWVLALRATDGAVVWTADVGGGCHTGELAASPSVVYVNLQACENLHAMSTTDASSVWVTTRPYWGAPVPTDTYLYVGACALRPADGSAVWCFQPTGLGPATVLVQSGVDVVMAQTAVYALNATSGALLWQRADLTDAVLLGSGPNVLYVGAVDGKVRALRLSDGTELWQALAQITATAQMPLFAPAQPQVVTDTLYVSTIDDAVTALRAADGSTLWRAPLGGATP
jgi:outer membrane protein assembly factor BamB